MTLERSQRALARARAKAHKTIDDFPLVTITGVEERVELRRVTGLLGAESVFVDVTGVTEALSDDDLIRIWPQPDKAGIYKFHSFVRRSGTNTAGDVFVPDLRTNTVRGPHGFTVEVFDTIGDPGGGHQSKFEWSNAGGAWRIHPAQDGSPAGLDLVDGNITLPSGGTVDGVDVSALGSNAILKTLVDAKGDLIVASADNTVTRLAVGSDGAFLIPDSGEPTGLKWTATLKETATALVVNDGQAVDKDFIVKGGTDAQLIVADYGEDAVAIGGAVVSGQKLTVYGQGFFSSPNFPPIRGERTTTTITNAIGSGIQLLFTTTQDMADGFGTQFVFSIRDDAGVVNNIAAVGARRDGADATGAFYVRAGGISTEHLVIDATGCVGLNRGTFNTIGAHLHIDIPTPTRIGLIVQGASGQTANVIESRNSLGQSLFISGPSGLFKSNYRDATTNVAVDAWVATHKTSGTPAAGFGLSFVFAGKSDGNPERNMAKLKATWVDATDATRKSRVVLSAFDTAEREGVRVEADGSAAKLGFFGTAAAAQAAAYTPSNVVADRSYDADATTLDEVADVLGTLIADLQSYGLLQ